MLERLNGEDGLGAIFPAMVNALEALVVLGYPKDDPRRMTAQARDREAARGERADSAYCQPCVSPGLGHGARGTGDAGGGRATIRRRPPSARCEWLQTRQLLDRARATGGAVARAWPGGGWAFQYANDFYPDLDDTAVIAWAMRRARDYRRLRTARIGRALDWLVGMQSSNGGFAAFDVDNTHYNLNQIPFADHGALLDPPTSDVTARVVTALARRASARRTSRPSTRRIAYLRREQEPDGSWFGRWGTNYIYGTWSVLMALAQARRRRRGRGRARARSTG